MKFLRAFGICALFLFCYYIIALSVLSFVTDSVLATIITNIIVSVFCALYCKNSHFRHCNKHKSFSSNGHMKLALFGFLAFMFVLWLFSQITSVFVYNTFNDTFYDNYKELSSFDSVLYLALTFFVAPIAEELLLRGVIFDTLKQSIPIGFAYFISSVVFALMHGTFTHLFLTFVAGFLFSIIYEYTCRLRYSIVFHSIFNILSVFCGGLELPDIFFEPVVFISIDILLVVVLIFMAYSVWNNKQTAERRLSGF